MKKNAEENKSKKLPTFAAAIEKKLKIFPAVKQKNLRVTLAKYERGRTSQWEERKLAEAGLVDTSAGALGIEHDTDICYTQEALAARMARHYQNPEGGNRLKIAITKKVVSDWNKGHALGKNQVPPPGPIKGTKQRFSFSAWTAWFDKNLLADKLLAAPATVPLTEPVDGMEEDFTVMEQREKRDAIKHRRWERDKERGEYVHRSIAVATGIAAVKRLHVMVKQEDERNHPKLRREKLLELGVAGEIVEKFAAWDKEQMREATDRREAAMEAASIELPVKENPE